MKPNITIQSMNDDILIGEFEKELIAYGGQKYGDNTINIIPRYNKNRIRMLRTELYIRMKKENIK